MQPLASVQYRAHTLKPLCGVPAGRTLSRVGMDGNCFYYCVLQHLKRTRRVNNYISPQAATNIEAQAELREQLATYYLNTMPEGAFVGGHEALLLGPQGTSHNTAGAI